MNAFPDDPIPAPPIQPEQKDSAGDPERDNTAHEGTGQSAAPPDGLAVVGLSPTELTAASGATVEAALITPVLEPPRDPAWSGLDVLRLVFIAVIALFIGMFTVLFAARAWLRPHASLVSLARVPLIVVAGQALAYVLVLAYMYVLVTRERARPDFLAAIHWNWPQNVAPYIGGGRRALAHTAVAGARAANAEESSD